MAVFTPLAFLSILVMLSFTSIHSSNPSNLSSWHAEKHEMSEFLNMAMQIALDQAIYAEKVVSLRAKNYTKNKVSEIAALSDCSHFLDNTIYRLNLVMHYPKCTFADKQTWLTMALANVNTCTTAFQELGILDHPVLVLANNLSMSLSNALAANHDMADKPSDIDGVLAWASNAYQTVLNVSTSKMNVSFVVAQDGSGDGKTIKEAINAASKRLGTERFVIYVKAGIYNEYVYINKLVKNVVIFGDGVRKTIITGNKHAGVSLTTSQTATFGVEGDGFIARDITFVNTAGYMVGQAVALKSISDFSTFYRCSFEAYQDTLFAHSGRQFYRECDIYGTEDFIFGDGTALFQNCKIYIRNSPKKLVTITVQKREDQQSNSGFIIHNSTITNFEKFKNVKAYLGRPWGPYSRTVVMESFLDCLIDPAGWLRWDINANVSDVYYAEYGNRGPGSLTTKRVDWKGYHVITSRKEASKFTVSSFLSGDSWLPSTNVPYNSGL